MNETAQEAVAVVGWITGDATPEDLYAWDSVEQPPWFELAGITGGGPNETYRSLFETTVEGQHVVVGLTFAPDSNTRIATVEVG